MLSHIATDLQQVYIEEVFTPQLGKPGASTPAKPKSSSDLDGDGDVDSFEKKVRQLIYDVRHIMKTNKVTAETAFEMRTVRTGFSKKMVDTAKEKLGIIPGSATSVSEEILSEDDKVGIVVNYKNGTTYRKSVSRDSVQSELRKFRSNPNVSSVERTGYGLAKRDYDGDGNVEEPSKEHAGAVHNAIQRKKGGVPDGQDTRGKTSKKKLKSYGVSEGFSNWRDDLCEVVDEIKSKKKSEIKEDPSVSNKVVINPEFKEEVQILGGTILEAFELNEEYLNEAVDIATEFFYNYGLNENGVDIVIEELGEETFSEFVFNLSEEYFLSEELKKSESNVKTSKAPKGTKQYATTIARVKKQGGIKMSTKDRVASTIQKDRVKKAVETAKETQAPSPNNGKKPVRDAIARGIFGLAKAYQQGMQRHRDATKTAGKALKVAGKGAKEFAGGVKSGVEATVDATKKIKKAVVGEAISRVRPGRHTNTESRQREIEKIQTDNARKRIGEDFETQTLSPQELNLRKQKASLEQRLSNIRQRTVRQQKPQEKPVYQQTKNNELQNQSYEPEGEMVDELNRFEIEKGINTKTGRPTKTGGNPEVAERNKPPLKYGGSRQKPKVRGEKPFSPSEGGVLNRLQNKAKRLSNSRQAAADFRMDTKGT